jgi:hypothetical protein
MTGFVDKLRLKEQAEEDTWFARRDRELIEALHARRAGGRFPARVVSGGQTGVDRGALDAAVAAGLPVGGWCPRGRRAEDGEIPGTYPLRETPSAAWDQRTEWNVRDSDATLILHRGALSGGTLRTAEVAARLGRPCLQVDLGKGPDPGAVARWLQGQRVAVLNVAGPRENGASGIAAEARGFLLAVLRWGDRVPARE